jgi:hypothetical protein
MRLQGVHDGALSATDGRAVLRERERDPQEQTVHFERRGRLPMPSLEGAERLTYRLQTVRPWTSLVETLTGAFPTTNVWWLADGTVLATSGRVLFASHDGGRSWTERRRLPPSSGPMGVLPSGLCERDETVYLGEYPLATDATPRVLRSHDAGRSWETALSLPDVRHVHAVATDPSAGDVWVTTGDTDDECRIGRLRDGRLDVVGGGSQLWRAVDLAFAPDAVFWGVDCAYRAENEVLRLDREALASGKWADTSGPSPDVVTTLPSSVYYAATLAAGDETWVALTTAVEPGEDRTAPADADAATAGAARVVAASSATDYETWHELASFEVATCPADLGLAGGRLPVACSYVFLAADPDRGLFYTPFNTARGHGELYRTSLAELRALDDGAERRRVESRAD